MKHILGSAVFLFFEPAIQGYTTAQARAATTAYIDYIKDPDGNELLSDQSMSETSSPSTGFFYTWQSLSSYTAGKYTARFKAVNGDKTNYKDHYFYLKES